MVPIDNCNYHYCREGVLSSPAHHGVGGTNQRIHHMKTNIISAVTPAILAIAAIVLSFRYLDTSALVAVYLCLLGIGIIATLDYRLNWKRMLGR